MLQTTRLQPGAGLDPFFNARAIAVIGASDDPTKIGGRPVHLLKKHGFAGAVFPINPKGGSIQSLPAYTSVRDVPQVPELAIIAVPAAMAPAALSDCADKGVQAAIVLSSGFIEAGEEGAALQRQLSQIARERQIRVLGPNCLGAVGIEERVIGSFSVALEEKLPAAGHVGIVSQSGNLGSFTMQSVVRRGMGISRFMATGNEADVDIADGIAALARDSQTRIILCCMETCRDGSKLLQALEAARAAGKVVVVLKIGSTEQGQAAAASHTGALTGSNAVIEAALTRAGALTVQSIEDMVELTAALSVVPQPLLPRNRGVTLVAASGGFGVMMADAMVQAGLDLPELSDATRARIQEAVPVAGTRNPVDATAQMSSRPDILYKLLTALLEDASRSTLVLLLSLSLHNPRLSGVYQEALAQIRRDYPDRLIVLIGQGPADVTERIANAGIAIFPTIDAAARGLAGMVRLGQTLGQPPTAPAAAQNWEALDAQVFRNEFHAKAFLARAGVPVTQEQVVQSADAAVAAAEQIGFPVVFKIVSPDIAHKTEVGGVELNIRSAAQAHTAHAQLLARVAERAPQAQIDGVLVAPMVGGGVEMITGISHDAAFGPVVMVGMGGIYAEVLKDVAVQVAPVTQAEALQMIASLKLYPLLQGVRGQPAADVKAMAATVARLSELALAYAGEIAEIDLNPVLVQPAGEGVIAVDALMVAAQPQA